MNKKIIQTVKTSEDNTLYIIDLTDDGVLVFRTSRNPKLLQKEKIHIEGRTVHTNVYFFDVNFLEKFIMENN